MLTPQARPVGRSVTLVRFLASRHGAPMGMQRERRNHAMRSAGCRGRAMATLLEPGAVVQRRGKARPKFYLWMGIAICAAMFYGFYQSFYLNHWFATPPGMRKLTILYIVHGSIFSLWLVFAVLQPA